MDRRKQAVSLFDQLKIWTGFYLAVFFIFYVSAVFVGRLVLGLDTNFYFGVAGINHFPLSLFFIPYYGLAIISFFGHLAAIHSKQMKRAVFGLAPSVQSKVILAFGMMLTIAIFYGLTNGYHGITVPEEYRVLIGE